MNQKDQSVEKEPFEDMTLENLVKDLRGKGKGNREYGLTILQRLKEGYRRDRHLVNHHLGEVVEIEFQLLQAEMSEAIEKDSDCVLFPLVVSHFTTILALIRELHVLNNKFKKSEEFRRLERERTLEARSMVLEMLKLEPCLKGAIRHLYKHELHEPQEPTRMKEPSIAGWFPIENVTLN